MSTVQREGLWLRSALNVDEKGYQAVVEADADVSFALDLDAAQRYAAYIAAVAEAASYQAKVVQQVQRQLGLTAALAGALLNQLRQQRPVPTSQWPITFVGGVSAFTGQPFVTIHVTSGMRALGQMTVQDALAHGAGAISAAVVADFDTAYLRLLVDTVEVPEHVARNAVAALFEGGQRGMGGPRP